jgi:polysaccharide export outer membrane protein
MPTTFTITSWGLSCLTASKLTAGKTVIHNTQIGGALGCLLWVLVFLQTVGPVTAQSPERKGQNLESSPAGSSAQRMPLLSVGGTNMASYVLLVDDLIKIEVYKEEDLKRETRIDQDGTIKLPLIESVRVAGKTIASAREMVKALYEKDYLVNADVAITLVASSYTNVVAVAPKLRFQVTGEVKKPGMIEIPEGEKIDLLQAIGLAGDFTQLANKASVRIRRSEGGKEKLYDEDVKKMLDGKSKPFPILPGDVITVRQTVF